MRPPEHFGKNPATVEPQRAVYAEQVKQLYSNALLGLLASAINSLVLIAIQRNVTSRTALIGWVGSLAMISLLRYNDIRTFWRRSPEPSEADRWGRRFIVGLAVAGMTWGSSAIFLFPIESLAHQTFLAFVIGGMVAGAAGAFSSVMKAFLAYSVPALCPIIVRLALVGDEFHLTMGGMVLLFGVMMFFIARLINTAWIASVKLRFENSGLTSYAEERTEELRKAYEDLKEEIEERRLAESQLRQAQKMEALGILTGGIAHDFNNILGAVVGFSELMLDHVAEGSREKQYLQRVFEAGLRGRDLIKQMLAFSRKTEQDKKPIQLSSIVKETMNLLRASLPTTIRFRTTVRSESGLVFADPGQIQQVLMNLCTNAAHAMQERGGLLHVELSDFSVSESDGNPQGIKPGLYARLAVRDTGTGISPDILDKVFDPFFTTKKPGEGTGLGLSVVHGIVKQHDGHITVESQPRKGSTFTVYLPMLAEMPFKDTALSDQRIPTGSERILFVDDEESLAEMGKEILEKLGYYVTVRTSSAEALALFKSDPSKFDLVITDQAMPEMAGTELAKGILGIRADMPIIMCTGFSYVVDADSARAAGIKAFAMKPLTKKEIARTVRKVLDDWQSRPESAS